MPVPVVTMAWSSAWSTARECPWPDVLRRVVELPPDPADQRLDVGRLRQLVHTTQPQLADLAAVLEMLALLLRAQQWGHTGKRRRGVPDQAEADVRPPADVLRPRLDLHHRLALGIPVPVREVGADHDQQIAVLHREVRSGVADQPTLPDLKVVVALETLFRLQRQHHRRFAALCSVTGHALRACAASSSGGCARSGRSSSRSAVRATSC